MDREGKPDHTQDPRQSDTGAGYPEEQPAGAQPGHQRTDRGGEVETPSQRGEQEEGAKRATGNPGAAGGR